MEHLLLIIIGILLLIIFSFLHLGQKSGNFTRTVSAYTLVRVLPSHMGQRIHRDSFGLFILLLQILYSSAFDVWLSLYSNAIRKVMLVSMEPTEVRMLRNGCN